MSFIKPSFNDCIYGLKFYISRLLRYLPSTHFCTGFCISGIQNPVYMKQNIYIYILLAVILWSGGCGRRTVTPVEGNDGRAVPRTGAATTQQQYEGTYAGSPPCFSGAMTTEVTLEDNRYLLKKIYILKSEHKGFEHRGEFTCSKDGGRIRLNGEGTPTYYIVGKDVLIPLDENGNPMDAYGKIFCLERVAVR